MARKHGAAARRRQGRRNRRYSKEPCEPDIKADVDVDLAEEAKDQACQWLRERTSRDRAPGSSLGFFFVQS